MSNQTPDGRLIIAVVNPDGSNIAGGGGGGGGGGGPSRAFISVPYKAIAAATGYAVGDLIDQVEEYNTATTPSTYLDTVWRNRTQETTLSGAPAAANISPLVGGAGGTVTVSSSALPAGAAVSTLQPAINADGGSLAHVTNTLTVLDAFQAPVVNNWTSATAQGTAVTMATAGYDTVIVTINPPAGLTAGAISFNVFDGAAWIPVKASRTDSYATDSTFSLVGTPGTHAWQVPVAGFPQFQCFLSTAIAGSGTVVLTAIVSSAPDTSIVTVGIDPSSVVPLPVGASTGALQTTGNTSLAAINTKVPALGSAAPAASVPVTEASISGVAALTVGTAATAGRQLLINCTAAGNVNVTFSDASTLMFPVSVGMTILPWQVTQITAASTTATATYFNLK